jgi:hypothetical protein
MRRALPIVIALALLVAPSTARAHELTVLAPGSAELDLGTVSSPRLVHATLASERDVLDLSIRTAEGPLDLLVLVPDTQPERGYERRPVLPIDDLVLVDDEPLVDDVTGIRYLVIARRRIAAGTAAIDFSIARGHHPTRIAVYVGDPDAEFAATDPERTPRTLARLRAWAETPAEGSRTVGGADEPRASSRSPWYGAVIALVAILTAGWWVRSGSRRAQERGVERSARDD